MTFTQTELEAIREHNSSLFQQMVESHFAGEEIVTKDNIDVLEQKFIDSAKSDDFQHEIDVFGKVGAVEGNPEFRQKYFCLYADVSGNKFCPDTTFGNTCKGCEFDKRENMTFVEMTYEIETGKRVEANYYTPNSRYAESLSTCCLTEVIDRPSGFYCSDCGEEN